MPRSSAVDEISLQLGRLSIHVRLSEEVQAEPGPVSSVSSRAYTSPPQSAARATEQARQPAPLEPALGQLERLLPGPPGNAQAGSCATSAGHRPPTWPIEVGCVVQR